MIDRDYLEELAAIAEEHSEALTRCKKWDSSPQLRANSSR